MEQTPLIYPNLNLFLYDIQTGFVQDKDRIQDNRSDFWCKVDANLDKHCRSISYPKNLDNKTQLAEASESKNYIETRLAELAKNENSNRNLVILPYENQQFKSPEDGFCFPVQLRDTYGLVVNSSVDQIRESAQEDYHPNYSSQPYTILPRLQDRIISKIHHQPTTQKTATRYGNIGQSWLFWAQLDGSEINSEVNNKSVAQLCWNQLTPNPNWKTEPTYLGNWQGAEVYECLRLPEDWTQEWDSFNQSYYHLIIILFPSSSTFQKEYQTQIQKSHELFLKFFCYHNKMVWSYWQHHRQTKQLTNQYAKLNQLIDIVQERYTLPRFRAKDIQEMKKNLGESLRLSSDYAVGLKTIQDQKHTLQINYQNYQKIWQQFEIERSPKISPKINPQINQFIEESYLQQMKFDYQSLQLMLPVTENLMRSLDGMINLEQADSDRQLNQTIQVFGTGLAVASITATIISTQVQKPEPQQEWNWGMALGYSIGIGMIAALLIALSINRDRRK